MTSRCLRSSGHGATNEVLSTVNCQLSTVSSERRQRLVPVHIAVVEGAGVAAVVGEADDDVGAALAGEAAVEAQRADAPDQRAVDADAPALGGLPAVVQAAHGGELVDQLLQARITLRAGRADARQAGGALEV